MTDIPSLHLLVVDDNRAFCEAITEHLAEEREIRYHIVAAQSAEGAHAIMRQATVPFDVLLIDQKLRSNEDGIQLMTELLILSPNSAAIVLTGYASREDGLRAMQAGAYRYLPKSADWPRLLGELAFLLKSLIEGRRRLHEAEWLRVMNEIAQQFQFCLSREDVARAIIDGAQRLGFRQARLWQVLREGRGTWLRGWKQLPADHVPGFESFQMPVKDSPYGLQTLASEFPQEFHGRSLGPSPLDAICRAEVIPDQKDLWVDVPLGSGEHCFAKLSLFHYEDTRPLDQTALSIVQLYANQVAAAFHRVELIEQSLVAQQLAVINERRATLTERDLDELLEFIRRQISNFLDTSNFYICLIDWEAREMRFRLKYNNGQRVEMVRRTLLPRNGFTAYIAYSGKTLRLSQGTERFRKQHDLRKYGQPAPSWLGVPIRSENKVLGVMVVQDYHHGWAYTQFDQVLLETAADQAAAAISNALLSMQAYRTAQQLAWLQYVSGEILKMAPTDLDRTLHMVLTAVTASYGLTLNRAILFLVDPIAHELRGRLGIGYLTEGEARAAWKQDEERAMNFDTYHQMLREGSLTTTPLEKLAPHMRLPLDDQSVFSEVVNGGQCKLLVVQRCARRIPKEFRDALGLTRELALIPLQAGDKVIGLLVVDNKFNRRPIDDDTLSRLQTFVNHAALAIDNARSRRAERDHRLQELEVWNQIQQAIIDIVSEADLSKVLESVVQQAMKTLRGVDAITLYYLDRETNMLQLGGIGGVHAPELVEFGAILSESVVGRVLQLDQPYFAPNAPADQFLSNTFVLREDIRSAAAFPLRYRDERVGCMFFNYRLLHQFDENERKELNLFAQQAALAIHKALLYNEAERRRRRFETVARITPVISAALDPNEVVRAILRETLQAVPRARQACMLHYEVSTDYLIFPLISKEFYRIDVPGEEHRERVGPNERSIARRVARTGAAANVPDVLADKENLQLVVTTRSMLCVPIKTQAELLGVLVLESDQIAAFSNDDQRLLEALADQAAVALKKAQEHSELRKTKENLAANSALAWVGIYGSNLVHTVVQYTYPIEGELFLLRQYLAPLSEPVERWLDEIQETVDEIKQLTDLTQKLSKKSPDGKHATEIDQALSAGVARWCKKRPDIERELDLRCAGVFVAIDKDDLEIPLEKLINNAIKAMAGKGRLTVRSFRHGGVAEVQVQDTGEGLDDVVRKYLFQEPVPRGPRQLGTGFGLLLARKIITDYGGDLKLLATSPEAGTTFSFYLPVVEFEAPGA